MKDGVWGLVCVAALPAMDAGIVGRHAHIAMAVEASGLGAVLTGTAKLNRLEALRVEVAFGVAAAVYGYDLWSGIYTEAY